MVSLHVMPGWCQPLLALDLEALPSGGDAHFVPGCVCVCGSNCRSRLELEQEAEGEPGYTRCLGTRVVVVVMVVVTFLPTQGVRKMRRQRGREVMVRLG